MFRGKYNAASKEIRRTASGREYKTGNHAHTILFLEEGATRPKSNISPAAGRYRMEPMLVISMGADSHMLYLSPDKDKAYGRQLHQQKEEKRQERLRELQALEELYQASDPSRSQITSLPGVKRSARMRAPREPRTKSYETDAVLLEQRIFFSTIDRTQLDLDWCWEMDLTMPAGIPLQFREFRLQRLLDKIEQSDGHQIAIVARVHVCPSRREDIHYHLVGYVPRDSVLRSKSMQSRNKRWQKQWLHLVEVALRKAGMWGKIKGPRYLRAAYHFKMIESQGHLTNRFNYMCQPQEAGPLPPREGLPFHRRSLGSFPCTALRIRLRLDVALLLLKRLAEETGCRPGHFGRYGFFLTTEKLIRLLLECGVDLGMDLPGYTPWHTSAPLKSTSSKSYIADDMETLSCLAPELQDVPSLSEADGAWLHVDERGNESIHISHGCRSRRFSVAADVFEVVQSAEDLEASDEPEAERPPTISATGGVPSQHTPDELDAEVPREATPPRCRFRKF